jgi:hypothetical protein
VDILGKALVEEMVRYRSKLWIRGDFKLGRLREFDGYVIFVNGIFGSKFIFIGILGKYFC